ncbi:MAG: AMP-binding protein [Campylobacteraceae bacterium]|jgi:acyl-coenzyme A synthetase/AMP-(fatty) acid ligase|nr:AMP-binding protein [Campylobacteraceae bacterium]
MKLIAENEDFTLKIHEVTEQNCKDDTLKNASGLIETNDKFENAVQIFKALGSDAKAILYDVSHKSLSKKLKEELKLPTLMPNSKEHVFCDIPYDVMLFTSGTTGMPSGVFKTKKHLDSEISVLERLFNSYNISKMVASVPFIHIYGILMLNLAKKMDIDLWFRERFLPADLGALVDRNTLVATTPLYINAFLQMRENYNFNGALFVSSTAPLSQEASKKFCERFNANVIQLYGSTETGGIAYRKNADVLWRPLDGVVCKKAKDDCLHVSSPWVSDVVYEGDFRYLNGQIKTFDEVEFAGEKFELKGRQSNIIKVGGKRFSTIQIENIIQMHEFVKFALINVVKNGNDVFKDESLIVYIEGKKPSTRELKALIKNEFGVNIPMKIVMVEAILQNSIGKKIRDFESLRIIS